MGKSTIGFVIPDLKSGGAQRVVVNLANELVNEYNVVVLTFVESENFYSIDKRVMVIACVNAINPSQNIFQSLKINLVLVRKIKDISRRQKIDLLIGFLTSSNVLTTIVSLLINIPVIICERNNPKKDKTSFFWRQLRKNLYKKADYLVVQTSIIKDYYSAAISDTKLVILPNPISRELSNFRSPQQKKQNLILNIGRLSPQKGHDILIKSFAKTDNEGWQLIILGEGDLRNYYEDLISELGLKNKIHLLGSKKDVHHFLNQASIFAFSSYYEGFPNALIEAMHFGLPCISTDCPTGPSNLIINGKNGFLVPMGDLECYSAKLNELMHNEELRIKFSKEGPGSVKHLEMDNVILKWKELISKFI